MVLKSSISWQDGAISWYNGPEWDAEAYAEFQSAAGTLQDIMRNDAPWKDRTGNARASLFADAFLTDHVAGVTLGHGVEYGFWLEVIQNGRFAIVRPTLEAHARRVTYNAIRRIRRARRGRSA